MKINLLIIFMLISASLSAREVSKYKDQTVKVTPNIESCSLEGFELPDNNCPEDSACSDQKICTCSTSNKKIKWKSTNEVKLKLKFSGNPPFNDKCGTKAKHHFTCTVKKQATKGTFDYDIYIETDDKTCDNPIDPRVIIK